MKKVAFTICAKNYIGLAQALETSILKYQDDVTFFIFVADEFEDALELKQLAANIIIAKNELDISEEQWLQMAFKYDLTEFCTSIKPSCFKYIFNNYQADACIYFDPDILTFDALDVIYSQLDRYSIMVTPHITTIEERYTGMLNERNLLYSGMFNLGFLGLKNDETSLIMLDWWAVRLKDRCYQNMMENYFTDQKWIDFLPSFFPEQLLVSSHLGLNVAPWNFYERKVVEKDDRFFIQNRLKQSETLFPLIFVHFSGFNYRAFLKGEVAQGNIKDLEILEDLNPIFNIYTQSLRNSEISRFINHQYSYNYFSNHVSISNVYRKLFRRLLEDGKINTNPFDASQQFYLSLKIGNLIREEIVKSDKSNISNVSNIESKTIKINRFFKIVFKIIGPERFFLLTRLMRLYSKTENHVYLIDKDYLTRFKIWN